MARVYLDYKNKKWEEIEKSSFWFDNFLYQKLKNLKKIQKKGWDGVIVIDGKERSGKSVLGMAIGWYLSDTNLTIDNFARGIQDASKKISSLPDGSVLIIDEGSTVFASKDSTTNVQKQLLKIMDVIGQKNMIFIICLPCYFDLNKTIAVRRSLFLCHVYPDKEYNRGSFAFWGEKGKKRLYVEGKRNYDSYFKPAADFVANYQEFHPNFYKDYLIKVKKESLNQVLSMANNVKKSGDEMLREKERQVYGYLKNEFKIPVIKLKKIFNHGETTIKSRIREYQEQIALNP